LLFGHLYRAVVNPSTRHAPRGMTLGTVDEDWAKRRHPKWTRHPNP
jgi:cytochrome b subunit of formate dehydrogenase